MMGPVLQVEILQVKEPYLPSPASWQSNLPISAAAPAGNILPTGGARLAGNFGRSGCVALSVWVCAI